MAKLTHINLSDLDLPAFEAHQKVNPASILELSDSIRKIGVIEPLIVRKVKKRFEIVAGCLRFQASVSAGLKAVPCIIQSMDDDHAELVKLHENLKRVDLDHVDQGETFVMMRERFNMTEENIANNIGKSISYVSNHIALVTMDVELSSAVKSGDITFSQSRELLNVKDIPHRRLLQGYCHRQGATIQVLKLWIKEWNDSLHNDTHTHVIKPSLSADFSSGPSTRNCDACNHPVSISDIRQLIMCPECCIAIKKAISEEIAEAQGK